MLRRSCSASFLAVPLSCSDYMSEQSQPAVAMLPSTPAPTNENARGVAGCRSHTPHLSTVTIPCSAANQRTRTSPGHLYY
jgi:hypothetical protein